MPVTGQPLLDIIKGILIVSHMQRVCCSAVGQCVRIRQFCLLRQFCLFRKDVSLLLIYRTVQAAVGIKSIDKLGETWPKLYDVNCRVCKGTGCMTCPTCHGTKTVRLRTLTPEAMEKLKTPGYVEPVDAM